MRRGRAILPFVWAALAATAGAQVRERMQRIVLPDRVFRHEALTEVLRYIEEESVKADPEGVGVGLVVLDNEEQHIAKARITVTLRQATVERALHLLATAAALTVRVEPNAVVIRPSERVVRPTSPETPPR